MTKLSSVIGCGLWDGSYEDFYGWMDSQFEDCYEWNTENHKFQTYKKNKTVGNSVQVFSLVNWR